MEKQAIAVCLECRKANRVNLGGPLGSIPICGKCHKKLPLRDAINVVEPVQFRGMLQSMPVPVAIFFWKPFDGPSEMLKAVYNEISERLAGRVLFVSVNVEEHPTAMGLFRLSELPAILLFQKDTEVARQTGHMFSDSLINWLGSIFGF